MIFLLIAATLFATPEQPVSETRRGVAATTTGDPHAFSASNGETMLIVWQDRRGGQAVRFDAAGHRLDDASIGLPIAPGGVFWNGEHWVVLGWTSYVRLDADGAVVDRVPRPLELPLRFNWTLHGAVWCGSAALLVTSDRNRNNLVAWRYDRDMNLIGQTELDSWSSFVSDNRPLAIGSDGSSALVVYRPDDGLDTYAARFDRFGQLERQELIDRVTDWRYTKFRAAIGSDGDRYAVVFPHDINSRVFRGVILDRDFKRRTIASFGVTGARFLSSAIASHLAFDGTVWTAYFGLSSFNRDEIVAVRIALNGSLVDREPVLIADHPAVHGGGSLSPPRVQSVGRATAVVYGAGEKTLAKVKAGTSVEEIAAKPASDLSIGSFVQSGPVATTSATQTLVAWRETLVADGVPAVLATRVDARDQVVDPQSIILGGSECGFGRMGIVSDGRDFLVAWEESHAIAASLVRADGSTTPLRIFDKGANGACWDPRVIAASSGSGWIVAWQRPTAQEGTFTTSAIRLAADGRALDAEPITFVSEGLTGIASDGVDYLIASGDEARRLPVLGEADLRLIALPAPAGWVWWTGSDFVISTYEKGQHQAVRVASAQSFVQPGVLRPAAGNAGNPFCDARGCSSVSVTANGVLSVVRHELDGDRFITRIDPVTAAAYPAGDGRPEQVTFAGGLLVYSRRVLDQGNATRVFLSRVATMRGRAVRH